MDSVQSKRVFVSVLLYWRPGVCPLGRIGALLAARMYETWPTRRVSYQVVSEQAMPGLKPVHGRHGVFDGDVRLRGDPKQLFDQLHEANPDLVQIEGWDVNNKEYWPDRFEWIVSAQRFHSATVAALPDHVTVTVRLSRLALLEQTRWRSAFIDLAIMADQTSPLAGGKVDIALCDECAGGSHFLSRRPGSFSRELDRWWLYENARRADEVASGIGWATILSPTITSRLGGASALRERIKTAGQGVYADRNDLIVELPSGACALLLSPSPRDIVSSDEDSTQVSWINYAARGSWLRRLLIEHGAYG
jgi:hypothetical protein